MKICLIGNLINSTLNFRKTLIETLIKQGHEVFVFSTNYDEKTKNIILSMGAYPIDYDMNRGGLNPLSDLKQTFYLSKKIKEIKPDVVFSYFSKPVIFGSIAAKIAGVKKIYGMLEGLGYTFTPEELSTTKKLKKKIIKAIQIYLYKFIFKFIDKIIFLNNDDYIDLVQKYNIKINSFAILGGIGVDLKKFSYHPIYDKRISFIFIARLLAEKGINEYLDAARYFKKHNYNLEFIVLGGYDNENPNGISQEKLESILKENIITYPGHVDNVQDWLKKSSIFVLPSYYREGVPCSTQEAMATGRAILTTNLPGCKETIIDGVNGLVVDAKNSEDLINKIKSIIKLDYKKMGYESRRIAEEKFCAKKQNEKLINYICK